MIRRTQFFTYLALITWTVSTDFVSAQELANPSTFFESRFAEVISPESRIIANKPSDKKDEASVSKEEQRSTEVKEAPNTKAALADEKSVTESGDKETVQIQKIQVVYPK